MDHRRLFVLSIGMKVMLIALSISLVGGQYLLGKIWFDPVADPRRVEDELEDDQISVDTVNNKGVTGLMFCAEEGFPKRAKILIDHKASLDMRAKNESDKNNERRYKNTALHFAVLNGDDKGSYEVAELLIKSGADVTAQNGQGFTVLHLIMEIDNMKQRQDLTKELVKASGNKEVQTGYLNTQNKNGETILHLAAEMNRIDWVAWLIEEYGKMLRFNIRNNKGEYPEDQGRSPQDAKGQLPEDKAFGHGGVLRDQLKKARELYDTLSDEEFKKLPKNNYQAPPK